MRHCDSALHVTGRSEYIDDAPPPSGMLHGVVFGSPVAHGVLKSLNVEAARGFPGVRSVLTLSDVPGSKELGAVIPDETLFADREVLYLGQPLALVVAETAEQARRALAGCVVEIESLPAVTCPREAYTKGMVLQETRIFEKGDVESVWGACAYVFEGAVDLAGQEHLYLETNRARAIPREDGQMLVYSSTQSPSVVQRFVASTLGVPMHKVEIDVKRLGGGFGGKEDQATHWACMAAMAAQIAKAPVQIVLNRVEDIQMTGKRHPYKQDFKIGLDADLRIQAIEFAHYQNSGAYMDLSGPVLERTVLHSTNAYAIPHVRILAAACRTNLPSNTAFRGFGGPQGMFPMECAIAKAAESLGVTRESIQEKNLISDGYVFHYGQKLENECRMRRTWDEAMADFDVAGKRKEIEAFNAANRFKKKGLGVMPVCFGISFTKTFLNQGSSLVHVYTDGSVAVTTGGIEMGQGISSNMIAICSRIFGISPSRIKSNSTNTSRIANISPSAASATSDLNGNATIIACRQILPQIQLTAAEMLEISVEEKERVSFVDGIAHVDGEATELKWEAVVNKTYMSRRQLMAHGFYSAPNIHFDGVKGKGRPFHYYTYGTSVIETTVDCLRGTYKIDAIRLVHDLGRGIVPIIDLGQIEGGITQGVGWVTLEELKFNTEGRTTSHALSTYKAPDGEFLPDTFDVKFLENVDNPGGPLGSKAVGEPPFMYGIAAYFALREAVNAFRGDDLPGEFISPLTPEQVLMGLYAKSGDAVATPDSEMVPEDAAPVAEGLASDSVLERK